MQIYHHVSLILSLQKRTGSVCRSRTPSGLYALYFTLPVCPLQFCTLFAHVLIVFFLSLSTDIHISELYKLESLCTAICDLYLYVTEV